MTCPEFLQRIKNEMSELNLNLNYYTLNITTLFDSGCARLNIFKYDQINRYDKILYLDTDILINSDIYKLLNIDISPDKIYALEEGNIGNEFWGSMFFDFNIYNMNSPAFTSGALYFRNSDSMKNLFHCIQMHIDDHVNKKQLPIPYCLDQPFIIYNSFISNRYDNQLMKNFMENNPQQVNDNKVIYHFPGCPGWFASKNEKMTHFWEKMKPNFGDDIVAVAPSNVYDKEKMKYLLESSEKNNFKIEIIGLNRNFNWIERMIWFREYLNNLSNNLNQIVCFTDAYDVFYLNDLNAIKNKFLGFNCEIVWSAEKWYSHQLGSDQSFYDNLSTTQFGYKYLNGGAFIGYKNSLLRLFNDILDGSLKNVNFINEINSEISRYNNNEINGSDQTWLSHHICKNYNNYNIKLDYWCDIFYTAAGDWDNIDNVIDEGMTVISTGKRPSIIHVPWISNYGNVFVNLFNKKYSSGKILENKKYTWGSPSNNISFFENGKMDAFGPGGYFKIGKLKFQANFGGYEHVLEFNENYTEFISTRKGDGDVVKGVIV
jgi:lipopolysaccharide biosynthesis glycosyltransferase